MEHLTKDEVVTHIMDFEGGTLSLSDTLKLFADLIRTGLAWQLQGSYGRQATHLIENGFISETGEIDWDDVTDKLSDS